MQININQKIRLILMGIAILVAIFLMPNIVLAHPGNTAADGCHYCRTNCDRWGVPWNERHCHNGTTVANPKTPTPTPEPPKPVCHEEKVNEDFPFSVQHVNDPELEKGKTVISTQGKNGVKEKRFKVCVLNGIETSRDFIDGKMLENPTNEVIRDGTKQNNGSVEGTKTEVKSSSGFSWPIIIIFLIGLAIFIWFIVKGLISKPNTSQNNK